MKTICISDIIDILIKYNEILKTIECKNLNSQIKDIDKIIRNISLYSEISLDDMLKNLEKKLGKKQKNNKNKLLFKDIIELVNKKEFNKINGIKLNYKEFNNKIDIVTFFESKSKDEIIKLATLIDLNLLYYLLSGNTVFKDIKKENLYNKIISYVKAMKQGEAFKNYTSK